MNDFMTRDQLADLPNLYVTIGVSRSGKSTWVREWRIELGAAIVCRDDVRRWFGVEFEPRLEPTVKALAHNMLGVLLLRGQNVIVDETNLTVSSRREFVNLAQNNQVQLHWVVFQTPPTDVLKYRAIKDRFDWDVLEAQLERQEALTEEELNVGHVTTITPETA